MEFHVSGALFNLLALLGSPTLRYFPDLANLRLASSVKSLPVVSHQGDMYVLVRRDGPVA